MIMEKGTLILIVCVIFGLGLFMVSKLGRFIKESRKAISDERSNLQLLKKVEMSSKGRKKNADMHVIPVSYTHLDVYKRQVFILLFQMQQRQ